MPRRYSKPRRTWLRQMQPALTAFAATVWPDEPLRSVELAALRRITKYVRSAAPGREQATIAAYLAAIDGSQYFALSRELDAVRLQGVKDA